MSRRLMPDEDHFGLNQIKEQVLQFISTASLNDSIKGKVFCLHGPPGTGKTSFAFSIARALGRNMHRISLGGESNATELKGHRRTYVNSSSGKIVKAMISAGSENCVIVLDEVDKIGKSSVHGDPESALLEILDPEQNGAFVDNFLDVPIDLSNVFFICTANKLDNISDTLLDRMNLIEFHSYSPFEKLQIFNNFIFPDIVDEFGLDSHRDRFELGQETVDLIIQNYSREPGIRKLKKYASQILQKVAFQILEEAEDGQPIRVTPDNLIDYIGLPPFDDDQPFYGTPRLTCSAWRVDRALLQSKRRVGHDYRIRPNVQPNRLRIGHLHRELQRATEGVHDGRVLIRPLVFEVHRQ